MKKILSIVFFGLMAVAAWAVPANPRPMPYVQPNGDTLMIRLVGDERFHFTTTVDGYLIAKNEKGYYCYAKWTEQKADDGKKYIVAKPTNRKAHNAEARKKCEQRWIEKQQEKNQAKRTKAMAQKEKERYEKNR